MTSTNTSTARHSQAVATAPKVSDILEKPLPRADEAERLILGAIMLDDSGQVIASLTQTSDTRRPFRLEPDDCFSSAHQMILRTAIDLHERGIIPEVNSVMMEMMNRQQLMPAGGPAYLSELVTGTPVFSNVDSYVVTVKQKAASRRLIAISSSVIVRAYDQDDTAEILCESLASDVLGVTETLRGLSERPTDAVVQSVEFVGEWLNVDDVLQYSRGIATGRRIFDRLSPNSGRGPGTWSILAGSSGSGKTRIALDEVKYQAMNGAHVLYMSYEMKRQDLIRRIIMGESGLTMDEVKAGRYSQGKRDLAEGWADAMKNWRLAIYDKSFQSFAQFRRTVLNHMQRNGKPDVVIVDHFGLYQEKRAGFEMTAQNALGMRSFVRDTGLAVLSLHQINREGHKSGTDRFNKFHIEGGGVIEQGADYIEIIQPPQDETDEGAWMPIALDKNRDGLVGWYLVYKSKKNGTYMQPDQDTPDTHGIGSFWEAPKKHKGGRHAVSDDDNDI